MKSNIFSLYHIVLIYQLSLLLPLLLLLTHNEVNKMGGIQSNTRHITRYMLTAISYKKVCSVFLQRHNFH
jgi:hypothetical protein